MDKITAKALREQTSQIAELKDKLHRRNMQIKDLKAKFTLANIATERKQHDYDTTKCYNLECKYRKEMLIR